MLDSTPIEAELSYIDQNTKVVYAGMDVTNERQKVQITVIKKDAETKKSLEGAVFGLYAKGATLSLVCYTHRYFRSCIIRQILTAEEDSRFMSHLCLMSSPMSHCQMTTVPFYPPCEAGKSVRLSLYRTLHS